MPEKRLQRTRQAHLTREWATKDEVDLMLSAKPPEVIRYDHPFDVSIPDHWGKEFGVNLRIVEGRATFNALIPTRFK